LVAWHRLRLAPQLRAAIFAQECKALVGRGSFCLIACAAVQAFDYNDCGLSLRQFDLIRILSRLKLRCDFYGEHGLAALYAVAVSEVCLLNLLPVDVSSVGRAKIAQVTTGRRNLKQAMVTRKKSIFGQTQVRRIATPYQERIVLIEDETSPGVWTG